MSQNLKDRPSQKLVNHETHHGRQTAIFASEWNWWVILIMRHTMEHKHSYFCIWIESVSDFVWWPASNTFSRRYRCRKNFLKLKCKLKLWLQSKWIYIPLPWPCRCLSYHGILHIWRTKSLKKPILILIKNQSQSFLCIPCQIHASSMCKQYVSGDTCL